MKRFIIGGIDNETDISGQIDLMNQAMEQGADGILLAPADSNSLTDSCQKVREKDIPVVLIDSSINSSEFDACYMTDNIDAGEMAAKKCWSCCMMQEIHRQTHWKWNPVVSGYLPGNGKPCFRIPEFLGGQCTGAVGNRSGYKS